MKFLSIDVGTSSVKAAVFDKSGAEIAAALREYGLDKPRGGWAEVSPEIYWEKTRDAAVEVLKKAGGPKDIKAVGVTSQGETLILLDKQGRPVRKAIVWLDTRASKEAGEIEAAFGGDRIYKITGQSEVSAGYTASLILWLKRNEPQSVRDASKFLLVTDYIVYKLTGGYFSNKALYPSTLYYDFRNERWWEEMLDFLEIKKSCLPELLDSGTPAGKIAEETLGLSPDTVVCPAPIDQITGALGAGNVKPGTISEATGTVLAICGVTDSPAFDRERRYCLFPHAVKGRFTAMPWAPSSGSVLAWFKNSFCPEMNYEMMTEAASSVPPGSGGLAALVNFEGVNCPDKIPDARGVFWGIALEHQKKHFIRAIMESVAYLLKDYTAVLETNGIRADRVISLGGAARSDVWSQIKADVMNKEIATNCASETVCLGAAMVAAAGTGAYDSCEDAAANMSRRGKSFMPSQNTAAYKHLYQNYRRLYEISKSFYACREGEK